VRSRPRARLGLGLRVAAALDPELVGEALANPKSERVQGYLANSLK
jgi:hypothetical protein